MNTHIDRVEGFVAEQRPVEFVLPAFPGKSPNHTKVLGSLPDMAELLSLRFLHSLCQKIQNIYAPGARMIICSDGRVFADLVRIPDPSITEYQDGIIGMIKQLGLSSLEFYGLDDEHPGMEFDEMRRILVEQYGEPIESLREEIRAGGEPLSLYRGITRFLLEDACGPGINEMSRTSLQKDCRTRAYGVIQRSKAWGEMIARKYPRSVRLSIHPQPCSSHKLGIHLLETTDSWMTPWHGTAVDINGRFVLMKRRQAEELGATLVLTDGRPSHYAMNTPLPEALTFVRGPRAVG
ncbi:MAG TPA: isocyanide synthase family protein [Myxococcaceae bacterium]|nr:isocyanide synthase family protein [Myxococcaceae bacterium]